jgi:hypothetical protein
MNQIGSANMQIEVSDKKLVESNRLGESRLAERQKDRRVPYDNAGPDAL